MKLDSFVLLKQLLSLLAEWRDVFTQSRTHQRAIALALGLLGALGRRTLTRVLSFLGQDQQDWTSDYRFFSRAKWRTTELFDPLMDRAIQHHIPVPLPIVVGFDDTNLPRTGKKIASASWHRDPMSPPFHPNLRWGQRFLQASLLLPLYRQQRNQSARALPVRFAECPVVRKPRKRAKAKLWKAYRQAQKVCRLSVAFVRELTQLRQRLDRLGWAARSLLAVGDGSFCNRVAFQAEVERTRLLCRARKNLRLCFRHTGAGRRYYSPDTFTPQEVYQDKQRPWREVKLHYGGKRRTIRYKEVAELLWRGGAKRKPLRLIVVAPLPYRTTKQGKLQYREVAYLLTDDLTTPVRVLLQSYLDRLQLEYNHRDEKDILGIGQAQVQHPLSCARVPEFGVAAYSALLLAGLEAYGPERTADYLPLPKWRRKASRRASCQDLVSLLRKQLAEAVEAKALDQWPDFEQMVLAAAA